MDAPVAEVISVTDKAARRIAALALKEGHALPVLRVRVTAGGCSGFTYELSFADEPTEDDAVIEAADGVRVLVDPQSAPIVRGSTLEFNDSARKSLERGVDAVVSVEQPRPEEQPDSPRLHPGVQRLTPGRRAEDAQSTGDARMRLRRLLLDLTGSI